MSILELARMVTTPRNLEDLDRVRQLHAIEREMLLGELKRKALMRLGELTDEVGAADANQVRACEVMRKACVDLLRSGGSNTEKRPSGNGEPTGPRGCGQRSRRHHREPLTPATEAEVLEALERWGEKIEEEEKEYPQITQIAQMGRGGLKSIKSNEPRTQVSGSVVPSPLETTNVIPSLSRHHAAGGMDSDRRESPPESSVGVESSVFDHTDANIRGCHGQVPLAREGDYPAEPRAESLKQQPCPWHPVIGSVGRPPQETTIHTGKMPVPLKTPTARGRDHQARPPPSSP